LASGAFPSLRDTLSRLGVYHEFMINALIRKKELSEKE